MRSEGARLHPFSVLVGVPLLQLVRGLGLPAFAVLAGGPGGDVTPVLLLAVLAVGLGARVLAWQRFRWSFDGRTVRVEQGVLRRSRRTVDVDRVQQVELDRPFVQRLLGVATVRVDTAGSDAEPEVELRVLSLADARALRAALQPSTVGDAARPNDGGGSTGAGAPSRVVLRVPIARVALAAVTGAQLLVAPAALLALLQLVDVQDASLVDRVLDELRALEGAGAVPDGRTWLTGVLVGLALTLLTAVVVAVVRDGGFVLLRVGDDLVVRRGLLGTRESSLPLRRVQVVRVTANPLRRTLGVATVRIHSAGGSGGGSSGGGASGGGERQVVVPLVPIREVVPLLADVLPDLAPEGLPPLRPHPAAAHRRVRWRRLRALAATEGPLAIAWVVLATRPAATLSALPLPGPVRDLALRDGAAWAVPLAVGMVLVVLQVVLARLEYTTLGHGVDAHVVTARTGTLSRTLRVAPLGRLQAVTWRASWFQARRGLATVRAHVAGPGGDVLVPDAAEDEVARLATLLAGAAAGGGARALRSPAGP